LNTLTASSSGLSGSPVLFSATATQRTPTVIIQSHAPDPSDVTQPVSVGFTVTASIGTPTGDVIVSDGVDSCTSTVAAGSCSFALSTPGSRTLTAAYQGDPNFTTAMSPGVSHQVNTIGTTTSITSHSPEPSVSGQGITVGVSVTAAAGTPAGDVIVSDGSVSCTITLSGGSGSCVLVPTTSGSKTLSATYNGGGGFTGSVDNASHQVDPFGAADPASSTASVPDGTTGNVTTILIQARDLFGNAVGGGGATVTVDITGANPSSAVVVDNGDGTYTATYTPANPGNDLVTIQINGGDIAGSPYTTVVN
jgi:hypothetical protein